MIPPSATKILPLTLIRRERRLPYPGEVIARRGDEVSPVQVVARAARPKGFTVLPAAEMLGVAPEELPGYLLVNEGTAIQRKKPLMEKPGIFGAKRFDSPVNGILHRVSHGRVIIQQTPELLELRAMLTGVVASTEPYLGVVIETEGALIQAIWGSGREGYGNIRVVVDDPRAALEEEHIGVNARGSILVAGRVTSTAVLEKAEENSVRGLVVGFVPGALAGSLGNYRFPVVATEGFGAAKAMAEPVFALLQQLEGLEASILSNGDGRPEIVVPRSPENEEHVLRRPPEALREGQRVRLLRAPYLAEVGRVVSIHARSQPTSTGFRLAGARVALSDGQVVFVPIHNLDLIN